MAAATSRHRKEKDRQAAVFFASGNRLIPRRRALRAARWRIGRKLAPAVPENG
jgi:hypothetical protein